PDLMPADIVGSEVLEEAEGGRRGFRFIKGPVFCQLLMADEINRASPRTQSALLQSMQEKHVTIAGKRYDLPNPFHVFATQNPIEQEGTYPLPEAQLDRFLLRLGVGYPTEDQELEVLRRRLERGVDDLELLPQASGEDLLAMRRAVETVEVDPDVGRYIVQLVAATRASGRVQVGASPRGSLALLKLSRCRAALEGRTYVVPEDVKALAVPALAHRLSLRPELWVQRISGETVVRECLEQVPVPRAR
ncbi:MAG: AAA family ATPase, partial [Candidatus Dormibacteraceae bacterium]